MNTRNTSGMAPLTPMSVSDPFPTETPAATPAEVRQTFLDNCHLRQQLDAARKQSTRLTKALIRANESLDATCKDLRQQIQDLRTGAIANVARNLVGVQR